MSEVFFIGDTHFGHRGILNFSGTKPFRQFNTIEEHDQELIRRWNTVVGNKDTVFHLGDFCFGKRNLNIAAQLNGNKKLVMGNHDMYGAEEYLKYFSRLAGAIEYKGAILTHIPVHPMQLSRYYMNIHGHLHHAVVHKQPEMIASGHVIDMGPDPRYVNVSCEQINLTPVPYDWILDKWAEHA